MSLVESARVAVDAIWAHKLRSFLTLLGVIIGVAAVIIVVMLVEGFNAYFKDQVASLGSNAFMVSRFGFITSVEEFVQATKRNKDITYEDLQSILSNPRRRFVLDAAASKSTIGQIKYGSQTLMDVNIRGVSHNMVDIDNINVAEGRYISREEEQRSRTTCFIGADVVKEFFPGVDPLGKEIKIEGLPFRVVGVAEEIGTILGQPQDSFVIIPVTTFEKLYGHGGTISIRVSAISPDTINQAVEEVRVVLRNRRHLKYHEPDNFGILTSEAINNFYDSVSRSIQLAIIGVASVALLVGGIVIMNIMLVSVAERTREIGVRKSVGARRSDIIMQFLSESIALSLMGGIIGMGFAYVIGRLLAWQLDLPIALPLAWTIAALVVSATIGLCSGVYPAYRAAGLDPVESLRSE
ncbi:MAG: ABC transporter permease [Acidobacteriota bacterium]|nr:ABC transporter permease [Blastocatellia bacterium]MDW8239294.1 ABC transporter permease [Acidobacteriota bacterium]